jgi:hypothetical protein
MPIYIFSPRATFDTLISPDNSAQAQKFADSNDLTVFVRSTTTEKLEARDL